MALQYDSLPLEILKTSLPDAVAWCSRADRPLSGPVGLDEADPTFRSRRLLPPLFPTDPRSVVWSVAEARRHALGAPRSAGRAGLHGGRLLYYEPSRSLWDGAACGASGGFFDLENAPPWDVWLCFADESFLVSWVPPAFLDRAAHGIEVNPECCINWVEDVETPFTRQLQDEGLAFR